MDLGEEQWQAVQIGAHLCPARIRIECARNYFAGLSARLLTGFQTTF